ncbi:MAG TPA: hypothetical protein VJA26_17880, partial [Gammaproteobacteria bacterium]|nr:hypothetical protein [Gammaproteobacteria bacterium]
MQCSATERCLGLLTTLRPGEGRSVILFFGYAFLLLTCYYVLKLLREPLLLVTGSAELKSYAYAAIALVLMLLVPVYGAVFRRTAKGQLVRWVTGFFLTSLMLFYVLGRAGLDIGFAYYVWVGVFGVTMLAQFWAHAAHSFDVQSGQRLFPVVMAGATLGALAGPPLVGALFPLLGPWNLMLVAMALLAATLPLVASTGNSVPAASRNPQHDVCAGSGHVLSGFALVMRDRYLLLLALLMVLLNCVNTTGEYILTELVIRHADYELVTQPGLDKGSLIAAFYGDFYFAVNALTVVLQVLLVARVFRWIGVHGAILVLPIVAIIGYGLIVFLPIFSIIRAVKIIENGVDYSMMNTARHALYLPLPAAHQYEGKTAIDTFFWRLGDVLQAGVIYVGLNWFGFEFQQFAVLNMVLASVWIVVAMQIARRYAQRIPSDTRRARRGLVVRFSAAALGLAAFAVSADAAADRTLFAEHEVLQIELVMDTAAFCRDPQRKGCGDAPASLVYKAADGREQHIDVSVRARGRWRQDTAACRLPALFVFFSESAASGTPFAGEKMLPLTTHCRETPSAYEQYVLKEYLAYRIYNLLTDKSLRVRLARITYRDTGSSESTQRYGFFTEHFDSLAARHDAQVW